MLGAVIKILIWISCCPSDTSDVQLRKMEKTLIKYCVDSIDEHFFILYWLDFC